MKYNGLSSILIKRYRCIQMNRINNAILNFYVCKNMIFRVNNVVLLVIMKVVYNDLLLCLQYFTIRK